MRALANFLVIALLVYSAIALLMYLFQARLVFLPNLPGISSDATPPDIGLDYDDVRFEAADGVRLHGWFIPVGGDNPVLLFMHGNAGNISHRLDSIALFHDLGLSVFIFDYRGYGRSAGRPSEDGAYLDAEAAWRYLTRERGVAADRIVLFGRSLGAAVASHLATMTAPAALVVESAFTSVPDIAAEHYRFLPVRTLARIRFDTRAYLQAVSRPVLVIHSADDEIIPFHHGQALYEAVRGPKAFIELRGGHNDGFFVSRGLYMQGLQQFIQRYVRDDATLIVH